VAEADALVVPTIVKVTPSEFITMLQLHAASTCISTESAPMVLYLPDVGFDNDCIIVPSFAYQIKKQSDPGDKLLLN